MTVMYKDAQLAHAALVVKITDPRQWINDEGSELQSIACLEPGHQVFGMQSGDLYTVTDIFADKSSAFAVRTVVIDERSARFWEKSNGW